MGTRDFSQFIQNWTEQRAKQLMEEKLAKVQLTDNPDIDLNIPLDDDLLEAFNELLAPPSAELILQTQIIRLLRSQLSGDSNDITTPPTSDA